MEEKPGYEAMCHAHVTTMIHRPCPQCSSYDLYTLPLTLGEAEEATRPVPGHWRSCQTVLHILRSDHLCQRLDPARCRRAEETHARPRRQLRVPSVLWHAHYSRRSDQPPQREGEDPGGHAGVHSAVDRR